MRITEFANQALLSARENLETSISTINDALEKLEDHDPLEAGRTTARALVEANIGIKRLQSIIDRARKQE